MQSLPVLMYHYISEYNSATSVSPQNFASQCEGMAQAGWQGISLQQAEAYFLHGSPLPPKSLLITFDDGYLDNYIHAWPILQRYGHQAVIFAVTQRLAQANPLNVAPLASSASLLNSVNSGQSANSANLISSANSANLIKSAQSGHTINPTNIPPELLAAVDNPWTKDDFGFLSRRDLFFSHAEKGLMQACNMSIAPHSARHLAVIASSNPLSLDFHQPKPRLNTFYHLDSPQPFGLPQFKERPALHSRAFRLYPEFLEAITKLVPQDAAALEFFAKPQCVQQLTQLITNYPQPWGDWESKEQQELRIVEELQLCLQDLGPQTSLCWPWGKGSGLAQNLAQDLGFKVFFNTSLGANLARQTHIHRFKVRNANWPWLRLRLQIYSQSTLAKLYAKVRI